MRTITYSYDTLEAAERNVQALVDAGIDRDRISILSNERRGDGQTDDSGSSAADGAGVGGLLGGTAGLLAGLGLIAIPGLGPVVAAGWLAATAAGAVAGAAVGGAAGGIVGALTDHGVDPREAHVHAEAVRRGGSLVSVRAEDTETDTVHRILMGGAIDIGDRRAAYETEGWSGFDPNAPVWEGTDNRPRPGL